MPTIEQIKQLCEDVSFKSTSTGKTTCRFYRDHVCIAAGHNGADCVVFPRQSSLTIQPQIPQAESPEPNSEIGHNNTPENGVETAVDAGSVTGGEDTGSGTGTNLDPNAVADGGESTLPGTLPVPETFPETQEGRKAAAMALRDGRPIWDMTWSWSRVNQFIRCPYKFYLHYILGLRPEVQPDWAIYGSAMHEALESFCKGGDLSFNSTGSDEVDAKVAGKLDGLYQRGLLQVVRDEYDWDVERKIDFMVPVPSWFAPQGEIHRLRWTTRLDLVSKDLSVVSDWKSIGKDPSEMRLIDVVYQMALYCMAVHFESDVMPDRVLINPIFKPKIKYNARKESAESFRSRVRQDVFDHPSRYFFPRSFTVSEINPQERFGVLMSVVRQIYATMDSGLYFRNAGDCAFGAKCDLEAECLRRI